MHTTSVGVFFSLQQMRLDVTLHSPYLVVPQGGYLSSGSSLLVVDLGTLSIAGNTRGQLKDQCPLPQSPVSGRREEGEKERGGRREREGERGGGRERREERGERGERRERREEEGGKGKERGEEGEKRKEEGKGEEGREERTKRVGEVKW